MKRHLLTAIVVLVTATSTATSAKVKLWHHYQPSHFTKSKLQQIVVSNEGALRLSRQLTPLALKTKLDATWIWDMVEDAQGNLYVATGKEGKVYRITPDGDVKVVHDSSDSQVFCLAHASDGNIYAGTGPSGSLVQIQPNGQHKVLCRGLANYVWSIAVSADAKKIYAGTGPHGTVYEVTATGKKKVLYKSRQDHILCVALDKKGQIYAGTDKRGLIYRISPQGKAFVLYQAKQTEIRALTVTDTGLYVGTSTPTEKQYQTTGSSIPDGLQDTVPGAKKGRVAVSSYKIDPESKPTHLAEKSESKSTDKKEESTKGSSTSSRSTPSSGENSLYHISPDGIVREVLREKALILSVLPKKNRLFVGTGMKGQLFEVEKTTRERSEIARLDHGQILSLLQRKDGSVVIATGDPGRLYVLKEDYATKGTIVSEVQDAKLISRWGSCRWQADSPEGTNVTFSVRTGNVEDPDETWSEWSKEQSDPNQAKILAPNARFLQYRLTLSTTDPKQTPTLRSLALRYRTTNQAPEVTKVTVPNLAAENLDNPKKLAIKWSANDGNEDKVTYTISARKEGWSHWVILAEDVEKTTWTWDTTTTPSGKYRIKVTVSDSPDNPKDEALTGSRISAPLIVNHEPPEVKVKVASTGNNQVKLEGRGQSKWSRLISASFTVNGRQWIKVFPKDKLFDSNVELLEFQTGPLKPGSYVVVLKLKDASGNVGSSDVVFTVKPE